MEDKIYRLMAEIESDHWWFSGRRNIIDTAIRSFVKLNQGAKILDVGCGTGGNLSLLSQFGCVSGLEMDAGAVEMAKERGLGQIYKGEIPGPLPFEENSFDLIVMLDVLEHIEDDGEAIRYLVEYLKPNGYLLITVPAHSFLWSNHDRAHHHLRRYTRPQLVEKLRESRLDIIYSSYFNVWLFPMILLIRTIKNKLIKSKDNCDLSMPKYCINKILAAIFSSEKYFIKKNYRFPVGVSIIACGKKLYPTRL
ncbi:MAG: class I SAM-dependent methyltransferase [Peptococcaceae bacterium]|nr:class I SAM-dependent methyltransferase [Peptococcaceae bacterium]